MSEETWDKSIPRSKGVVDLSLYSGFQSLGNIVTTDVSRQIVCADCGVPAEGGVVCHLKPETYTVRYKGEEFYIERHIGVACGCAKKRGLVP